MASYVRVNGTWRETDMNYVRVGGTWRDGDTEYVRVNGVWREGWKGLWDSISKSSWTYQHNNSTYGYITAVGSDSDGNIYIGTNTGYVEKISPSGSLVWRSDEHRYDGRNRMVRAIAVNSGGMVFSSSYSSSYPGRLALHYSTGSLDWAIGITTGRDYRSIAIDGDGNDAIVIDSGPNYIRRVDWLNGAYKWNRLVGSTTTPTFFDVAVAKGYSFMGTSNNGLVYRHRTSDGSPSGTYSPNHSRTLSVQVGGENKDDLYIATGNTVEKINPDTLSPIWSRSYTHPAYTDTSRFRLICGDDGMPIILSNESGTRYLTKYDKSGNQLYKTQITSNSSDILEIFGRYVYFFRSDGLVERWEH